MKQIKIILLMLTLLSSFAACKSRPTNEQTEQSINKTSNASISEERTEESTISSTTIISTSSEESQASVASEPQQQPVNLGTIFYQDLDINDPIQGPAHQYGFYIVDDGTAVNFIPLMSGTVQTISLYIMGDTGPDSFNIIVAMIQEVSTLTGGKTVNAFDVEGGQIIITAVNGEITYSL